MISVALIWIYIIIIGYILGFSVLRAIGKSDGYEAKGIINTLMAGICTLIVYAQLFSLFYRVSLAANIILCGSCAICVLFFGSEIKKEIARLFKECGMAKAIGIALLFLLFAYGTSHGYMHYDSDLYHAQSIRWIEEYGVVPGLGNLHTRLAYNSAAFPLSALFSFAFLGHGSFHVCQGLIAFLVFAKSADIFQKKSFINPGFNLLPRIVAIYYICNIYDEMVSPASDYFVVLMVLYIVIAYLDLCDRKEKNYCPYALLCLVCLITAEIKISAALITLIVLYPLVLMLQDKKTAEVIKYLALGIGILVPFLIRNVILSGYLVYPVPGIDIFDLDFKIPKGLAEYDSREIQVFGRGHSDVTRFNEPLKDWIFEWFSDLDTVNKAAFAAGILAVVVVVFVLAAALLRKKKEWLPELVLILTVDICFCFFIVTSPNIRYCCVFLYLAPVLTLGFVYFHILRDFDKRYLYRIALCTFLIYRAFTFGKEFAGFASWQWLMNQQGYGEYELVSYELHGTTFYYPEHGDRTGYDKFPAAPLMAEDIFRGENIKDGFKDVVHTEER